MRASVQPTPATQPSTRPAADNRSAQIADFRAQLDQIQERLERLQQQQQRLNQEQQDRQTAAAIARDAQRRDLLLDSEQFPSGYDLATHRFLLQSDDGKFIFHPWLELQVHDVTNVQSHVDKVNNGIELRRADFGFDGTLFSRDFRYSIYWATYRQDCKQNVIGSANEGAENGKTIGSLDQQIGGLPVMQQAEFAVRLGDSDWWFHGGQVHDPLDQ